MDEQDRLDELFAAPGGEAGYVPPSNQIMNPCCFDDDESEEELAPDHESEEELAPAGL
jgi:hypothetical protein